MYLELRIYETYTDQWREYAVRGPGNGKVLA